MTRNTAARKDQYMEKRHADGSLDLSEPQPPFMACNLDEIGQYYYSRVPGATSASWEEIKAWYAAQGFVWRPKTW